MTPTRSRTVPTHAPNDTPDPFRPVPTPCRGNGSGNGSTGTTHHDSALTAPTPTKHMEQGRRSPSDGSGLSTDLMIGGTS